MLTLVIVRNILYGNIRAEKPEPELSNARHLELGADGSGSEQDLGSNKTTRRFQRFVRDDGKLKQVMVVETKEEGCPSAGDKGRRPSHLCMEKKTC